MSKIVTQCIALSMANLKSLPRRLWISLSMVFSVAMIVVVLLGFLAMANGFQKSLQQAGSPDVAIALGTGASTELGSQIEASQIDFLTAFSGIALDANDQPVVSEELVLPVDAIEKSSGLSSTLSLRGVGQHGLTVRPAITLREGRDFTPGAAELIVGQRLAVDYQGLTLGSKVTLGSVEWTVVGIFTAGGSVFESEMFADNVTVRTLFNRPGLTQSLRIKMTDPAQIAPLAEYAQNTPQITLPIRSEEEFFAGMAERTTKLILLLGWPLAIVMALGAGIGAMTTMYSSVADRVREIATVRTLGFSRRAAFVATWVEAMFLSMLGCILGVAFSYLVMDGWAASTTGADQTQIGFQLSISWPLVVQACSLALAIGAIGGGLPALNATRVPLRVAMSGRS